jgi:hypothetical protein
LVIFFEVEHWVPRVRMMSKEKKIGICFFMYDIKSFIGIEVI